VVHAVTITQVLRRSQREALRGCSGTDLTLGPPPEAPWSCRSPGLHPEECGSYESDKMVAGITERYVYQWQITQISPGKNNSIFLREVWALPVPSTTAFLLGEWSPSKVGPRPGCHHVPIRTALGFHLAQTCLGEINLRQGLGHGEEGSSSSISDLVAFSFFFCQFYITIQCTHRYDVYIHTVSKF
jgi:hypothetical protein